MKSRLVIAVIFGLQAALAILFLFSILNEVFGFTARPIDWQIFEVIQIGAALGLLMGAFLGGLAIRQSWQRAERAEEALRVASGAFSELLEDRFVEWGLTPAERDVALFAIKGLSTAEIAGLRATSEGTIKAQTSAIYRKAGVSGRPQLLSLFVEDLMDAPLGGREIPE
ncbi:MAG: LuxR C-terminal-related transcriptional regulator [Pseudomonadota bacterium]